MIKNDKYNEFLHLI